MGVRVTAIYSVPRGADSPSEAAPRRRAHCAVPGNPKFSSSIALVSAVGPAGTYCNVMSLAGTTVNVACFAQGGVATDSKFELTFQAAP